MAESTGVFPNLPLENGDSLTTGQGFIYSLARVGFLAADAESPLAELKTSYL